MATKQQLRERDRFLGHYLLMHDTLRLLCEVATRTLCRTECKHWVLQPAVDT